MRKLAFFPRLCYNLSRNHNFYAGGVPMPHFTESLDALRREAPARFLETDQFAEMLSTYHKLKPL